MSNILINVVEQLGVVTGGTFKDNMEYKHVLKQYWNTTTGEIELILEVYIKSTVPDGNGFVNDFVIPVDINGTTTGATNKSNVWLTKDKWTLLYDVNTMEASLLRIDFSSGMINVKTSITCDQITATTESSTPIVKGALYQFSDEDKTALKDSTAAIRCKLIVKATDSLPEIVLTDDDAIKDWTYTDERYVPQQGFIGQFVARTLSGNLQDIDDNFNIENREVELQVGVMHIGSRFTYIISEDGVKLMTENGEYIILRDLGEDQTNWYSFGNFIITNPEDNEVSDNTKFEAMDYAKLFNAKFDGDFMNDEFEQSLNTIVAVDKETGKPRGKVTALWLAKYVCAQAGVEFGQEFFTNSDFEIDFNSFQAGETCRDVMKEIAKLAFSWVRIDWDNKCYIDFGEGAATFARNATEEIDNDQYYSLETKKEIYGPINRVYVGMSGIDGETLLVAEDVISVAQHGEKPLYIYDNPLIYSPELREKIKDNNSASKLLGLSYAQLTSETVGHLWLKGNEQITFLDMENTPRSTYAFNRTIEYSGHVKSKIDTMGESEVEETLAYENEVIRNIKNAKILVEKHEGRITEVTTSVERVESDLEENYYTRKETNEVINQATSGWTNTYTTAGGNNRIRNSGLYFEDGGEFDFWEGTCEKIAYDMAVSQTALMLQPGQFKQEITGLPGGVYTLSFDYEILNDRGNTKILVTASNAVKEFSLRDYVSSKGDKATKSFDESFTVNETRKLTIVFETDVDDACIVYDLMCNVGASALVWTQHQNEMTTDTVNISKGITITSSADQDVTFKANYNGIRIEDRDGNRTTTFTNKGMETEEGIIRRNAIITDVKFIKVDKQTWITG